MKVNDTVYRYEIRLDFKDDKVEQTKEESKIIGVNKYKLCIDDDDFTTIKHAPIYKGDKDYLFTEVGVIDWSNDRYLNCIYGYLYTLPTEDKKAYKRIKKALENHINKKLGKYTNISILLDKIII